MVISNDVLRLEVEVPVTGIPNLIRNPLGERGTWGWVTPLANTNLTGAFTFTTTTSQAAYFTSEAYRVPVGRFCSARIDLTSITAGHYVRLRLEWLDAAKAVLSSSTQGASTNSGIAYAPIVAAPAGTVYVRLRVDLYNGTGTVNAAAGAAVTFTRGMVTHAATSAEIAGTSRPNLVTNYSFNTNVTGWAATFGAVARITTPTPFEGTGALQAFNSSTPPAGPYTEVAVTAGNYYTFSGHGRVTLSGESLSAKIEWRNASGTVISSVTGAPVPLTANAWGRASVTGSAPSGATVARLIFIGPAGFNAKLDLDGIQGDPGPDLLAYYGAAYSTAGFDFNANRAWRDILGPTHEIALDSAGLETGLLSATVLDADLDPAAASVVTPGKAVRLTTFGTSGKWEVVYEGTITAASTTYAPRVRVTLEASDNIAALAQQPERRGVGTVAALPFILEGKGVPWSCNGSGNQVAAATIVSTNENASTLDQVTLTRDSDKAYAWVDRFNVLNVRTRATMPTSPVVTFSDAAGAAYSYRSDILVDYSMDSVINSVTITWLRLNAATQEVEEITYGPYLDQTSIDALNGLVKSAEFTLQGATESASAIAAYAAEVLSLNSTPAVTCHSLSFPVRTAAERQLAATIDLYSPVRVIYGTLLDKVLRVTGIEMSITPDGWITTLTFDGLAVVAQPAKRSAFTAPGLARAAVAGTTTPQAGSETITGVVANTMSTKHVTFAQPFAVAPIVMVTARTTGTAIQLVAYQSPTTTGFEIGVVRNNTVDTIVDWYASVPTQ